MDLVEFLRARLDRDEQTARACSGAPWLATPSGTVSTDPGTGASDNGAPDTGEPAYVATAENGAYAEHIARHDPSRTLAEVAARRQILDEYEKQSWILGQGHRTPELEAAQSVREKVLRLLALPYATHPAYQEEWRP
ncbi:DUF6221 family protein [Actinomadura madurae]|uniref:DUF6221 family protein n=1 Tax=Actinomadura madurae TaxID=1993 RepID=UPI0020274B7F|nr:DUF6221 family protein [Actinomadura madurae]MCP9949901.1 DUF6221 family protein [Actinomadura madurae]MCP9966655.1 DUF6221 family protein [Actinomadura madurae]MCP9979143.1 DUF6221 family protein [Actinomadura madurae]MCQ0009328.1 DUF6221 family protein [Actinomadura madurae]MCQ0015333.1 DUF6221 family protein [Actinomadura madurae]